MMQNSGASGAGISLVPRAFGGGTIKEKLCAYLESRPGGADTAELVALLLDRDSGDSELKARIVEQIIGADPNFIFDPASGLWSLRSSISYRVPLDDAQFTVVDLETTGMRTGAGGIIEIGAYRMLGRRLAESFSTLVRPRGMIPRFITRLTSITNEMVADAPPIEQVLPAFRDFMGDSVMVAHNAAFDRGFLDFEFRRIFGIGLRNPVICTLRMSRRFLPSLKRRRLDLLAEHFGLSTDGRHRGLGDARMAAEILSIFLEMAEKMGITRLDRLLDDHARGVSRRRIERHVPPEEIAALPRTAGVYLMRNQRGDLLYVGKARRLRDRVSSYFTHSVTAKTAELINHVYKIETRDTASSLEAALVEAEMIRELKPPYNRMLKSAPPAYFIKLDLMDEFPRLMMSTKMSARRGMMHLGPFVGRNGLERAIRALSRITGMRTCAGALLPDPDFSPCMYGQIGYCASPCNRSIDADSYARRVHAALGFLRGQSGPILSGLVRARDDAARAMRYEEAARLSRELESLTTLSHRVSRLREVVTENNLMIITGDGASRVAHVVLSGRLALTRALDSDTSAQELSAFVAENYDRYRARPIDRAELEPMMIVARWLHERYSDEGRIVYLHGSVLDPSALAEQTSRHPERAPRESRACPEPVEGDRREAIL